MKYSIAQITSSAELETQNKNLQNQSSDYKFDSLRDTIKMCYELNQKWMLDHYKKDVILIHVPIEIKD
jgi:hypothetical protein